MNYPTRRKSFRAFRGPMTSLAFMFALLGPWSSTVMAQSMPDRLLTEEMLWQMSMVQAPVASPDGQRLIYGVKTTDLSRNKSQNDLYLLELNLQKSTRLTTTPYSESEVRWSHDGQWLVFLYPVEGQLQLHRMRPDGSGRECLSKVSGGVEGFGLSPTGGHWFYLARVRMEPTLRDRYPELPLSSGRLYDQLMHRHWDRWHDGTYSHVFVQPLLKGVPNGTAVDLLENQPYHSPLQPMGSSTEIAWSPNGEWLVYPSKKMNGNQSAVSTNSDLYAYHLPSGKTQNITESNPGYDTDPVFSPDGQYLAWLSMARDGYEADLNRVALMDWKSQSLRYLNTELDRSAYELCWAPDAKTLYYGVYDQGSTKIFAHPLPSPLRQSSSTTPRAGTRGPAQQSETAVRSWVEITNETAQYSGLIAVPQPDTNPSGSRSTKAQKLSNHRLVFLKSTMLRPSELCIKEPLLSAPETTITQCNDSLYGRIQQARFESRWIPSSDGKAVQTYIIYPPNFDPNRRYPTLIYCQGGPQSMIGQAFSMRWNFHLMAAKGYIVVAPNRRGLPGFGQAWNEQISGDWGGQAMNDLLWVTDSVRRLPFVDASNVAAVGASFGGYSVYWLAGHHNGRYKSLISHCGVYNLESMFGQTEEIFFSQWDMKGRPWDRPKPASYTWFSPHRTVDQWTAPILVIHNENDFRVPLAQGLEAYTAAQLRGLKTKLLYFPDENHWVIKPQNSVLWQKVFFDWLDETLR
ncbi:MAG: S9 family peptidase [Cytophagia bacterium]|nr:S9 family peptidase [Cytophagia bacterium]